MEGMKEQLIVKKSKMREKKIGRPAIHSEAKSISIKLEPTQRKMLEIIAERKYRIAHNLSHSIRLCIEDVWIGMLRDKIATQEEVHGQRET